jgi:hypothetical protein
MDWGTRSLTPETILDTQADREHTALTREMSEHLLNRVREVAASIAQRVHDATESPSQAIGS